MPEDALPDRPFHNRMMPGKRSKGNPDPSRAPAPGAAGTAAAGRDDRAVLPDSVDVAGWRRVAAGAGRDRGKIGCSSAVLDHSGSREKTERGIRYPGKPVAEEPLRQQPPCAFARRHWTTAPASWQVRTSFDCGGLTKVAIPNPVASNGGVPSDFPPSKLHYTVTDLADDRTDDSLLRRG